MEEGESDFKQTEQRAVALSQRFSTDPAYSGNVSATQCPPALSGDVSNRTAPFLTQMAQLIKRNGINAFREPAALRVRHGHHQATTRALS